MNTDPTRPRIEAPATCPACGSSNLAPEVRGVSAESYSRCIACGEIWHVDRRGRDMPRTRGWSLDPRPR